jgi:hypothetical protein
MLVFVIFAYVRALLVSRHKLALEAVALRQQLAVFKRKQSRPKLRRLDRLFWIALRSLWPGWTESLILVKPETVVSWHRAGFRLFWRWRSRFHQPMNFFRTRRRLPSTLLYPREIAATHRPRRSSKIVPSFCPRLLLTILFSDPSSPCPQGQKGRRNARL